MAHRGEADGADGSASGGRAPDADAAAGSGMAAPTADTAAFEAAAGKASVALRPGTAEDAVGGTVPRTVAAPADAEQVADTVVAAAGAGCALAVRGAGTKLDWGAPPERCDVLVDTSALDAIDHAAGDLIATAGAGTPLARLQEVLSAAGQRLPLDEVVPGTTVGGAVATALAGPGRVLHGRIRDLIIGMEVVRADGVRTSSGGRVVKNVAGYDLAKLHTGALGTLGVTTSVTFRLRPLPGAVRVVEAAAADPAEARDKAAAVLRSTAVPAGVEVDAEPGGPLRVRVLLEGSAAGIGARTAAVEKLIGAAQTLDALPGGWGRLPGAAQDTLLKAAFPPAALPAVLALLREGTGAEEGAAAVSGSAGSGVLWSVIPAGTDPGEAVTRVARLRAALAGHAASLTVPRAAPDVHAAGLDPWGEVPGLPLMESVKDAFDPHRRLAPGRYAGGI
ncbi:FAD-binding oxidoreductase [Nocardiopsis coralliicola]